MKVIATLVCAVLVSGVSSVSRGEPSRLNLNIEPKPMALALKDLGQQTGLSIVFQAQGLAWGELKAPRIAGELSPKEALEKLLANTGLTYKFVNPNTVWVSARDEEKAGVWLGNNESIRVAQVGAGEGVSSENTPQSAAVGGGEKEGGVQLEEVVVTGSHIRGAPPSSPMLTIGQEEMRLSGHSNLGDVIRALPQNFAGGQNPGVIGIGLGGDLSNTNITGGSSLNLRGLGPDATLTLLNGARLPFDGVFQATDVSVIPVAAIDRIEVVLDGASAIYGSDAVAGVANILLKRDYEGVELSARYGVTSDGGNDQSEVIGVGGTHWGSGGFLLTADFSHNTAIRAGQRDYLSYLPAEATVYPKITQKSGLFSGHQQVGERSEFSFDAFYTERETLSITEPFAAFTVATEPKNTTWGASPSLRVSLPREWSLSMRGFVGGDKTDRQQDVFFGGAPFFSVPFDYDNKAKSLESGFEGPLASLPAGDVRIALGLGYRENKLGAIDKTANADTIGGSRGSYHVSGEVSLPLIGPNQHVTGIHRLTLNGALRYEDYGSDDFGSVTTPKFGIAWGITQDVDFRASWGKSFKAPTLRDQFSFVDLVLYPASRFVTGAPPDASVLTALGGNSDLKPERAEITTAGLSLHPQSWPGLVLEAGWFHIDYTDRVVQPLNPFFQALTNPIFSEFVTLNPTLAEQNALIAISQPLFSADPSLTYDPAKVIAIASNRNANASRQTSDGVDFSARYTANLSDGDLSASLNSTWLTSDRKLTSQGPEFSASGVIYFPAKFRARAGLAWSQGALTLSSYVNHIGGVKNTNVATRPEGDTMTTMDAVVDYNHDAGALAGWSFNLAVTNLFDKEPPTVPPLDAFSFNYDWTNYSAIGRVISATVTKKF